MQEYIQAYVGCLEDDISTSEALAIVFDSFGYVNSGIDAGLFSSEEVSSILDLFRSFDSVLGLFDFSVLEDTEIPEDIQSLLAERNAAKQARDYALADSLRDQMTARGYRIVDDKNGSRVEKI